MSSAIASLSASLRSVGTVDGLQPAQGAQTSSSADNLDGHPAWSPACGVASPNRRPPPTAPSDGFVDTEPKRLTPVARSGRLEPATAKLTPHPPPNTPAITKENDE